MSSRKELRRQLGELLDLQRQLAEDPDSFPDPDRAAYEAERARIRSEIGRLTRALGPDLGEGEAGAEDDERLPPEKEIPPRLLEKVPGWAVFLIVYLAIPLLVWGLLFWALLG